MNEDEFVVKEEEYEQFKESVFDSFRNLAAGFNSMVEQLTQIQEDIEELENRVEAISKSIYGQNLKR